MIIKRKILALYVLDYHAQTGTTYKILAPLDMLDYREGNREDPLGTAGPGSICKGQRDWSTLVWVSCIKKEKKKEKKNQAKPNLVASQLVEREADIFIVNEKHISETQPCARRYESLTNCRIP